MKTKLILLAALYVGAGWSQQDEPMVRVTEPTVMTVHSTSDRLHSAQSADRPVRKPGRFKLGGLKALTGAGSAAAWVLNVEDDVPSSREKSTRYRKASESRSSEAGVSLRQ